jgi:predicted peptidase
MISHAPANALASAPSQRLRAVSDRAGYDYLISLPEDCSATDDHRSPLLLFLHGSGQRGSDVWQVTQQGIPRLLMEPAELTPSEHPAVTELAKTFIVISPQCPAYEVWDDSMLLSLIDDVVSEHRVDEGRVYLTGLSMGGFGAWSLGIRNPHRFAAIVPICGGGRVADVLSAAHLRRSALEGLGVWAFHGAKDGIVPLAESERMVEALKAAGGRDVRLTIYPEADHDAWTPTYSNLELYAWLLRHERPSAG